MFRRFLFVSILASAVLPAVARSAEPSEPIVLWPNGAPNESTNLDPEGTEPSKPGDNTIRVTNVTAPTITIYRPAKDKDCGAAVVICPGGGYRILAFNKEGTEVAEWLNTLGVTGIVLKYRVPARTDRERYAAPLEDVQRAISLVRHRASELGLDSKKIGVLGFSAGGHLAATVSNNYDERTYPAVDDADKVSCKPDFSLLIYPAYLVDKATLELSPEMKVSKATPPTFIAMAEDDNVGVEGPLMYYLALKKFKVPGEMHLYPTGGHGYGLRPSENMVSTWPARAADWLRTNSIVPK